MRWRLLSCCICLSISALSANAGVVADLSRSLGITPEALAASGCTAADAQTILQQLHDATEDTAALATARASLDAALIVQAAAAAQLRDSSGDPTLTAASTAADANLSTARHALDAAKSQLRTDALAGIGTERVVRIQRLVVRSRSSVAIEFRAYPCTDTQFEKVEHALAAEARSTRLLTALPESQATLLATVRADSEVQAASTRMESIGTILNTFSGF